MTKQTCISLLFFSMTLIGFSQPKLSLDKPEINLGTLYSGEKKQGKLVIKNLGNDTLRIYSVQPSCGCTAIKQPKQYLLPNESDEIGVEFNSAGYHGYVEKHINITSNDPTSQNISAKLFAEVKEEIKTVTGSNLVWFGNLSEGNTDQKNIPLVNTSDHTIRIKKFSVSSPSIEVKLSKMAFPPNDTIDMKISVKAEKAGYNIETLTIETNSENQPYVEVRISFMCARKQN
jgi:hypothetical protein